MCERKKDREIERQVERYRERERLTDRQTETERETGKRQTGGRHTEKENLVFLSLALDFIFSLLNLENAGSV